MLQAPIMAHRFEPSQSERVFAGGNWRAVPILRALAHGFFSEGAQAIMRARGEPLPRWTVMLDDDAYVFVPQMLAALAHLDADQSHYLGYAFIAAPHLEGIIPGKRQPIFANGGAGIAVSRGALIAALPIFSQCEATYKWNWPGDVRVAQCLLDAGVTLTWIHSFHAEAPGVIIHKQPPPPGSVPVGLHLPPISFHHVDADTVHALEMMQAAPLRLEGQPHEADFSAHAFQPLSATHPTSGVQVQLHYGFEVLLCPAGGAGCAARAAGTGKPRGAHTGVSGDGSRDAAASGLSVVLQPGKFLTAFEAVAGRNGAPTAYRHSFTGGECWQRGRLMGGLSASVTTYCGEACATSTHWGASRSPSGLVVCNFTYVQCTLHVSVGLLRCPLLVPLRRSGLDAGTAPGWADVVQDGAATQPWAKSCIAGAADSSPCAIVRVNSQSNLTLWFRTLSGSAELRVKSSMVSSGGLYVEADSSVLLLSGAVLDAAARIDAGAPGAGRLLEPPATAVTFRHTCETGAVGDFDVHVDILVQRHVSLGLAWRAQCTS